MTDSDVELLFILAVMAAALARGAWRLYGNSEIRYGQGKLIGFLVRRVRGLVVGRCPRCKAAMGWNRRCPYDTVD